MGLTKCEVGIIGAGPYGLAIAARLRERGTDSRIFGTPMQTWRTAMPRGMLLKSDGAGTNLPDPEGSITLEKHCASRGLPYTHHATLGTLPTTHCPFWLCASICPFGPRGASWV